MAQAQSSRIKKGVYLAAFFAEVPGMMPALTIAFRPMLPADNAVLEYETRGIDATEAAEKRFETWAKRIGWWTEVDVDADGKSVPAPITGENLGLIWERRLSYMKMVIEGQCLADPPDENCPGWKLAQEWITKQNGGRGGSALEAVAKNSSAASG